MEVLGKIGEEPLPTRDIESSVRLAISAIGLLQPKERCLIGVLPQPVVQLIPGWVELNFFPSFDVRAHYRKRHPETREQEVEQMAIRTILGPGMVIVDRKYPNTINAFRLLNASEAVMVSISVSANENHQNRVKSVRVHLKTRSFELLNDQNRAGARWEK